MSFVVTCYYCIRKTLASIEEVANTITNSKKHARNKMEIGHCHSNYYSFATSCSERIIRNPIINYQIKEIVPSSNNLFDFEVGFNKIATAAAS